MHSLTFWDCNKRPVPSPFWPFLTIPSAAIQTASAHSFVLLGKDTTRWGGWICPHSWLHQAGGRCQTLGFPSKRLWKSAGSLVFNNKWNGGTQNPLWRVSNLKTQQRKRRMNMCRRWVPWSLVETSRSLISLGKSEPVFLFFPYSSEFCASKMKSSIHPTPAPPQTSHFVFICEKNISCWLFLTTLDNEQGNDLKYFKMKKNLEKHLASSRVVPEVFQRGRI